MNVKGNHFEVIGYVKRFSLEPTTHKRNYVVTIQTVYKPIVTMRIHYFYYPHLARQIDIVGKKVIARGTIVSKIYSTNGILSEMLSLRGTDLYLAQKCEYDKITKVIVTEDDLPS